MTVDNHYTIYIYDNNNNEIKKGIITIKYWDYCHET